MLGLLLGTVGHRSLKIVGKPEGSREARRGSSLGEGERVGRWRPCLGVKLRVGHWIRLDVVGRCTELGGDGD